MYKDKGKQKEANRVASQKRRDSLREIIPDRIIPPEIIPCVIPDASNEVLPPEILEDIDRTCAARVRLELYDDREERTLRAKEYQVWKRDVYPVLRASIPVQHELVPPKGAK